MLAMTATPPPSTCGRRLNQHQHPDGGFSLVEVLVGMAIGLIGLLVIFKTLSVWDSHTRSTSVGGDAQVAGALAMYGLERDIKQAGMGFGTAPVADLGCTVDASDTVRGGVFQFSMSPVQIVPGAGGAPDTIDVMYGNSSYFVATQTFTGSTDTTKTLATGSGFKRGDLAVVVAGLSGAAGGTSKCALIQITDDAGGGLTVTHANGSFTTFPPSAASGVARFNSVAAPAPAFTTGRAYNLGPAPQLNHWEIAGNRSLARTEVIHNTARFNVAEGVINLKAQYGVDATGSGRVTVWSVAAPVDLKTVLAVRVSILVRSQQYERRASAASGAGAVTVSAPAVWSGSTFVPTDPTSLATEFVMTNVDGSADSFDATSTDPNNWRNYRYRVYDKVIPLRNMIWGTSTAAPS